MIGYKFKAHNQTVGRSPKTAQQYNESLNPATDGCRAEGCPPTWTTRGEDEVREFILYNQDRRGLWREIVLHIRESEERASGRFHLMYPRSNTEGHPLQELEPPVVIEKVIEPLTHEQIATVFDSMNPNTVLGARNTAIYSLMLTPASGYSKSFVRKTLTST